MKKSNKRLERSWTGVNQEGIQYMQLLVEEANGSTRANCRFFIFFNNIFIYFTLRGVYKISLSNKQKQIELIIRKYSLKEEKLVTIIKRGRGEN